MKKIAIIASVIASALLLVSCSTCQTTPQAATASQAHAAPAHHHDYKGEG
jgi:PBP1b-binding outer membrane lipoprotein LpoB